MTETLFPIHHVAFKMVLRSHLRLHADQVRGRGGGGGALLSQLCLADSDEVMKVRLLSKLWQYGRGFFFFSLFAHYFSIKNLTESII